MSAEPVLRSDLTPLEFGLFRDWIHRHSGIFLEESKVDSLRLSLHTRAAGRGFDDYRDYFRLLSENEDEFRELMNLVTINETSFFRFPAQFDALRDHVVPDLLEARASSTTPVRIWSAGCSTGEEPYTIAMTLLDSRLAGRLPFQVVGTDVSSQALERARSALYSPRSLASLPVDVVDRWFEPAGEWWRPIERVRRACRFEFHNLIREPHPPGMPSGWDAIFCRNVTIYFQVETTRRVIQHLHDALNPGGYLFLGHSETLASVSELFETVEAAGVFFYRKPSPAGAPATPTRSRVRRAVTSSRMAEEMDPHVMRGRTIVPPVAPSDAVDADRCSELSASAHALLEQARPQQALELALTALESCPADSEARLVAAFAHADLGDLETAARETTAILAMQPLSAPARYLLGVIRREQGAVSSAISEFRRTLYIDDDFVLARFALASIHRESGNAAEAAREYESTLRALSTNRGGAWTAFLGGLVPELLAQTCARGLEECRRSGAAAKGALRTRR